MKETNIRQDNHRSIPANNTVIEIRIRYRCL